MRRKFYTVLRERAKAVSIVPPGTRIVPLQDAGAAPVFFIVDSYPDFIDVVQLMGADHPVLSLVGQEETQTGAHYSIAEEASAHAKTIIEQQPSGPYLIGGCSASGIVAYETARQLRELGHEIGLIVLFDTPNPCFMGEYSAWRRSIAAWQTDLSRLRWAETPGWLAAKAGGWVKKKGGRLARIVGLGRSGAPGLEEFGPLEIRIAAAQQYRPEPAPGALLVVKRSREHLRGRYLDERYGWGDVARGKLEVCVVSAAEHLEIFKDESDRIKVAARLRSSLDRAAAVRLTNGSGPVLQSRAAAQSRHEDGTRQLSPTSDIS
jgi:Thioesterase domain